jgi:ribosome recycling factor
MFGEGEENKTDTKLKPSAHSQDSSLLTIVKQLKQWAEEGREATRHLRQTKETKRDTRQ